MTDADLTPSRTGMRRDWLILMGCFVLVRIPSFFEPQWYSDEAGYASTAWFVHLGKVLYVTAWNNKPPLLYSLYEVALRVFGANEAGIHVLSFLTGAIAVGFGCWFLLANLGRRGALIGSAFLVILIGTPLFDGELALPESLLIGPVTAGMLIFLMKGNVISRRSADIALIAGIGILLACGVLIQQTALGDCGAIFTWCLVRRRWRDCIVLVASVGVMLFLAIGPVAVTSGFHATFYALVRSYVDYVKYSYGTKIWSDLLRVALAVAFFASAYLYRKAKDPQLEFARLWSTVTLVVAIAPGYPYEHFLLPCVTSTVILAALFASRHLSSIRMYVKKTRFILAGALMLVLVVDSVHIFNQSGWFPSHAGFTAAYYPTFVLYAGGVIDTHSYDQLFGPTDFGEAEADAWIAKHHLQGSTAVVWSSLSWPYADERLRPLTISGPLYVTVAVENGTSELFSAMERTPPKIIIYDPKSGVALMRVQSFIAAHHYVTELQSGGITLYVLP